MKGRQGNVQLDLNSPGFQRRLFELSKDEQHAVLKTLRRISQMSWHQVYQDRGLKWEAVSSRKGPGGETLYTLRCSRVFRMVGYRVGDHLRLLSLHPDHDSAYR